MDKGSAGFFWCYFGIFLCVNLPFIVCDLVFASDSSVACVTTMGANIEMNLSTWLQADGYCRLAITCLLLISAIIGSINFEKGLMFFGCTMCFTIIYSLFQLAWLIVGAVLFWGDLNSRSGLCDGTQVQGYMFALLILSFIGIFVQCITSKKSR